MATENLKTDEGWAAFLARHKGQATDRTLAKGQYMDSDGNVRAEQGKRIIPPEKVHWHYELGDGSTVDINQDGEIGPGGINERAPSEATGTKAPSTSDWSGQRMQVDPATGEYVLFGFDPADQVFKRVPGAPAQRPPSSTLPPSASTALDRLDARGQVIPAGDLTTPVAKIRDPSTGTVTDMPDPKDTEGKFEKLGDTIYFLKAGQQPQPVVTNADPQKVSTFQGPNGSQWEYDPTKPPGQRATEIVKGERKPDVAAASQISWRPIPGTNDEQGYRIVDGKMEDVEGAVKPRSTTMIGDANSKTWTFLDAQGNVVKEVPNKGYTPKVTAVTTSADQPNIVARDETGKLIVSESPNYQPTTAAQVAERVAQWQQQMRAKSAELQAKVGPSYSPEQYASDFKAWYDQTIEPQKAYLNAAQQQIDIERAQKAEETRRASMATAQAAGTQALEAYKASGLSRVGPRAGEVASQVMQGKPLDQVNLQGAAFFSGGSDYLRNMAEQATMNALKNISPTAAAAAGAEAPAYGSVDVNQALGQQNYAYPGAAPPAAPAPPPVPPPAPVGPLSGTVAPPGWAGTNLDPNLQGVMPPNYPGIHPLAPPTWQQAMPNFGNPRLPNYVYGG